MGAEIAQAIPAAIAAGVDIYSAIKGDSAKAATQLSPAAMTGDQAGVANEFNESVFGGFDPTYYLKNNPDLIRNWNDNHPNKPILFDGNSESIPDDAIQYAIKHWNKWGKSEGRLGVDPDSVKTYEEKIAEDNAYLQGVDQKLVDDQAGTIDQYQKDYAQTNQQKTDARTAQSQNQANVTGTYIDQIKGDAAKYEG